MTNYSDKVFADIQSAKEDAKKSIEKGVLTKSYSADAGLVIKLLNDALATELVCYLRYKNHYYKAKGLGAKNAAAEFLEHANQELGHSELLAERITQLGGEPKMGPTFLKDHSHAEYMESDSIQAMITANLIAERIAVEIYRQMIKYIGNDDPTTRRVLEEILSLEEEHTDDLLELKEEYEHYSYNKS